MNSIQKHPVLYISLFLFSIQTDQSILTTLKVTSFERVKKYLPILERIHLNKSGNFNATYILFCIRFQQEHSIYWFHAVLKKPFYIYI